MHHEDKTRPAPNDYILEVRQQPVYARIAIGKEKDRKPIDPPPIVQLTVANAKDPNKTYLQNPYLILTAKLWPVDKSEAKDATEAAMLERQAEPKENDLLGTVVSSLYSLKDTDNTQGGFFVFGDLSVRKEGIYKLQFVLYELRLTDRVCVMLARTMSDSFNVFPQKNFPGMAESTFLTRSFSDQGVRLRLRKDSRSVTTRKRNSTVAQNMDRLQNQHQPQYRHDPSPEHLSPIGGQSYRRAPGVQDSGVPLAHMDRSRGSMGSMTSMGSMGSQPNSGFYNGDSPQMREYGSGQYDYSGYDERPNKRARVDRGDGNHAYDSAYPQYPRTVPEPMPMFHPISTGYATPTQPAMQGLPTPNHHYMPRLDTHNITPHSAGPNSATSAFSPGTRRSPASTYYHQPQPAIFSAPSAGMAYHQSSAPPLAPTNGLGIHSGAMVSIEEMEPKSHQPNGSGMNGSGI
ncbi:velvet factor-domain-containing protein [Podospora didyma]|uniref:Velvet factor-domain-containing protein n=1 Tax=Podospora didyma TaxID=330526 RepID=A0AAE0NH97_9PEZI|nr:velvet factor-domain-containing protein [Podospora didyma]